SGGPPRPLTPVSWRPSSRSGRVQVDQPVVSPGGVRGRRRPGEALGHGRRRRDPVLPARHDAGGVSLRRGRVRSGRRGEGREEGESFRRRRRGRGGVGPRAGSEPAPAAPAEAPAPTRATTPTRATAGPAAG